MYLKFLSVLSLTCLDFMSCEKELSNIKLAIGGNILYGIQTAFSFMKSDITLNIGKVSTQDFKATPLIPFYFMLGYNCRIF